MKCPVCPDSVLSISDRQGVEIDFCPKCRGVWLDRGELDKILEKSAQMHEAPPQQGYPQQSYPQQHQQPYPQHKGYKRRKSFLEELFD